MPLILSQKELPVDLHEDVIILHPSAERPPTRTPSRIPPVTTSIWRLAASVAVASAVALFVLMAVTTVIGDFAIEVTNEVIPWASSGSMIGVRLFTDKFDHFDGPCFAHTAEIGRLRMEASFGSWSPSVGTTDYANVAKGGKSILALTSPLYSPSFRLDLTRMDKTFWKSFSPRPPIHPPEMALSGSTSPGQCWAFAGHTGQLGIQLSEPVRIFSFTVEHTSNSSLTESAPRTIILWGLISKDGDGIYPESSNSTLAPQFGALYHGIPLASVIFDAIQGQPRQTFPLRCRETRRPFNSLVAQFVGNWGHPDFTCLYRFEIHGKGIDNPL